MKKTSLAFLLSTLVVGSSYGEKKEINLYSFAEKRGNTYEVYKESFKDVGISHKTLDGLDFWKVWLTRVMFSDVTLNHFSTATSNFIDVIFDNVTLKYSFISGTSFANTKITNSKIVRTHFHNNSYNCRGDEIGISCNFSKGSTGVIGLSIESTEIRDSVFLEHSLKGLEFKSSSIDSCRFKDCDLEGCDLSGAYITNSVFFDCKMDEELKRHLEAEGNIVAETREEFNEKFSSLSEEMKKKWGWLVNNN
ncbi:pentapeptide repeat-containing protein [Candidatus Babeliales bacterium]|nr:pentapeptide repeat-containing protein [Candidatus Babeliales bacterium]